MKFVPHKYQDRAIDFTLDRLYIENKSGAGLFLDPGLGKTAITLKVIDTLRALGEVRRVYVVAPLRVCYSVWPAEIRKWGFKFSVQIVHGTARQRAKALQQDADIYLINPEGLPWLAKNLQEGCDLLVVDESTKFKNWSTKRTAAMRKILPECTKRMILTGTPSPNSMGDLFSQIYILDDGETLGKTLTYFRAHYMQRGGFKGYSYTFNTNKQSSLEEAIAPMVLRLDAEDHLDMPRKVVNEIYVDLPGPIMSAYRRFERELFLALDDGESLTASSAGAAYASCRGIANGGVYVSDGGERKAMHVHDAKVEAFKDLVEELAGKPVLGAYSFKHDVERLTKAFPKAPVICGGQKPTDTEKIIKDWNAGRIQVLLAQPQAMSHGLNMQGAGHDVAWIGLTDQLEVYQQFNARLWRQGNTGSHVRFHHILATGTVDEAVWARIRQKAEGQTALLDSLRDYARRQRKVTDAN